MSVDVDARAAAPAPAPEVAAPLSWREVGRLSAALWVLAIVFTGVALWRSQVIDIPMRDPKGALFSGRLLAAARFALILIVLDSLVRAVRARRAGRPGWGAVRARWTASRLTLVAGGLLAYHLVYVSYRNLKSWDAFNTPKDRELLALDSWVFGGHSPAVLLHDLLGRDEAAVVLTAIYRSFTYLVVFSVVAALVLMPRARDAYLMIVSVTWAWVLGLIGYYLVPSLGPFASAPQEFADLRPTAITSTQAEYLTERAHLLANPSASDAFSSISAFPSLHVGVTTTVLLVVLAYRWRALAAVLAVFWLGTVTATVYFGWHFVSDDIGGVALALASVSLARAGFAVPDLLAARRAARTASPESSASPESQETPAR